MERTKRWLSTAREAAQSADACESALSLLYDEASGVSGIDYSKGFTRHMATGDAIPNAVIRMDAKRSALADSLRGYRSVVAGVRSRLRSLNGKDRTILELRYCEGMEWGDVADCMGYSRATVMRRHAEAVKAAVAVTPMDF